MLTTQAVVDRGMSSFKLEDTHTYLEDGQGFVLLTDCSEDLCALYWGQPVIRLVLRVPHEGIDPTPRPSPSPLADAEPNSSGALTDTLQRIEREQRRGRGQLQLQLERNFMARFRDASALLATFDDLPWPHYIRASWQNESFRGSLPRLEDAYDMLDASSGVTLKQSTKLYRDRMLFWHSDKFHYPLDPNHETKVCLPFHCTLSP